MLGQALLFGLIMQVKKDRANAAAEEILRNMEPIYVPEGEAQLNERALERIQNLLDKVDTVAQGVENASVTVKSMKEGQ